MNSTPGRKDVVHRGLAGHRGQVTLRLVLDLSDLQCPGLYCHSHPERNQDLRSFGQSSFGKYRTDHGFNYSGFPLFISLLNFVMKIGRHLIRSWIIEPAAYCNHVPLHVNSTKKLRIGYCYCFNVGKYKMILWSAGNSYLHLCFHFQSSLI